MYHFDFYMPAKVLFGAGRLQSLHEEKLPGKKALIATTNGKSVKKYGYLTALEKELDTAGVAYELFDQIRPNPTSDNVMDGAALAVIALFTLHFAKVGLVAVHRYIEVTVFANLEQGILVNGNILTVHLNDDTVNGPAKFTGTIEFNGNNGTCFRIHIAGVEVHHLTGCVSNGDTGHIACRIGDLLYFLDKLSFTQGTLDSPDIGFQRRDALLQIGQLLPYLCVIVGLLLGATCQQKDHTQNG